jgi:hypothetical protein
VTDVTWRKTKAPGEKLTYTFGFNEPEEDGGPWLDEGDTLTGTPTVVDLAGVLAITNVAKAEGDTAVVATIAGGVLDTTYLVRVTCNTTTGQIVVRTLSLRVVDK